MRVVTRDGRVAAAALALAAALCASCATDPGADDLWGFGDPVRGAALQAPRTFGDTSRWAGRPAEAALAAERLEFLTDQMRTNPRYAPEVNPAVTHELLEARAEMRRFLGIAPDAPPEVVVPALRRTAEALRDGSLARAEAALSGPAFTTGPLVTLARLGAMPRLPQAAAAAGLAAAEVGRLDRSRR